MSKVVLFLIGLLLGIFGFGWLFMTLWNWFVVPLGAPAVGFAHAI